MAPGFAFAMTHVVISLFDKRSLLDSRHDGAFLLEGIGRRIRHRQPIPFISSPFSRHVDQESEANARRHLTIAPQKKIELFFEQNEGLSCLYI
jgi:hypothetical protein